MRGAFLARAPMVVGMEGIRWELGSGDGVVVGDYCGRCSIGWGCKCQIRLCYR
jgi:hypothetical protein